MLDLTSEQFTAKIKQNSRAIVKLLEFDLPIIIGKEASEHFKKNFQAEGWERTKWKEVKRREDPWVKGARKRRKILTGDTGDLGRSIQYSHGSAKVTIHSDLIYAAVHNFGQRAGRGKGFTMPKRQFVGESEILNKKIEDIIETKLNKILNT